MRFIHRLAAASIMILGVSGGSVLGQDLTAKPEEDAQARRASVPDTLMFTIDEMNDIQSRVAAGGQADGERGGSTEAIENATLYLSTILYYGPQSWTIWINGRPISPGQDFQAFQVTDINAHSVELLVPLSAQGMRPVRLSPNQTFVTRTGAVVEGPWK